MGGIDKGLTPLGGKPMVKYVLERLTPQVGAVLLNANRHQEQYTALGPEVIPDTLEGYQGPLAGMLAGLKACSTPLLVTAPCDTPFLPRDYVARMHTALNEQKVKIAVATDGRQLQPVFCLLHTDMALDLEDFLKAGNRKVGLWLSQHPVARVSFTETPQAFVNINTLEELSVIEKQLHGQTDEV